MPLPIPVRRWLRLLPALLLGCSVAAAADAPPSVPATAGTWRPREPALAHVVAGQRAELRLPFAARITDLAVEAGARVQEGDLLARLEAPSLRRHLAAWRQALRQQSLAGQGLRILRREAKSHVVTRAAVVQAEQDQARARTQAEAARAVLAGDLDALHQPLPSPALAQRIDTAGLTTVTGELSRLRAPFSGLVERRLASPGERLAAGAPILELAALDTVLLDVEVPRAALARWRDGESYWQAAGRKVVLHPLAGVPRYDPATGLWRLRFRSANPDLALRDGMWIEVTHRGPARTVVWVPAEAVAARNGRAWCIVQQARGGLRPVAVTTGPEQQGRIPVLTGLQPGQRVVTRGAYELLYRDLKELIRFED